ncbi:MAG: membrane dipeptidase [Oscillospiraceae bacterium]|nr:membrane dipeptidase [Oscillospiraceae bacterium]
MKIIDLHCDTIMRFYAGAHLAELTDGHIGLSRLRAGECMAQCFAIFVPTGAAAERHGVSETPEEYFQTAYAAFQRELARCADSIRLSRSAAEILANDAAGYMSAVLTVEDGVTLAGRLENLDDYYEKGVRMVALTWNYENSLGYPQSRDAAQNRLGLKPFGIAAVERMNELGIAVDVSHLSEGGFWDVARVSRKPFVASHSCCRHYRDIARNLSDAQLRAVAESGGVVGVNFAADFLHDAAGDPFTSCEWVVKHLRHMADVGGMELPALGSDYDGIRSRMEWKDCGGAQMLAEAIVREFGTSDAEKICSGNALRALRDIIG